MYECRAYAHAYRTNARKHRIFHSVSGFLNIVLGASTSFVLVTTSLPLYGIICGGLVTLNTSLLKFMNSLDYFAQAEKAADDYDKLSDRFQLAYVEQETHTTEFGVAELERLMVDKSKLTDKYEQPTMDVVQKEKEIMIQQRNGFRPR